MSSNYSDYDVATNARPVTPAELRDLAARAEQLSAVVGDAFARLAATGDKAVRRSGIRLGDAAMWAQRFGAELEAAAGEVARIRGRSACPYDWGVCPEHGNTLRDTDGVSWCDQRGCGRRWSYSRQTLPCTEPVVLLVRTPDGFGQPTCAGHARAARRRRVDLKVTPLASR